MKEKEALKKPGVTNPMGMMNPLAPMMPMPFQVIPQGQAPLLGVFPMMQNAQKYNF